MCVGATGGAEVGFAAWADGENLANSGIGTASTCRVPAVALGPVDSAVNTRHKPMFM